MHSWGLTMPPKLVHRKLQVSCFRSLGSSNRHAKTDTHCTHMHEDTPVRRGQGSGEKHRDDGREEGGRQATAVPLTVNQAREASGPECPKTLNQVGQTFLGRSSRGYRWWMHWGEWRGGIHSELGNSIPGWRTTWNIPMGVPGLAHGPPHHALASDPPAGRYFGELVGLGCENSGPPPLLPSATGLSGATGACSSKYTPCLPYTPGKHSQLLT